MPKSKEEKLALCALVGCGRLLTADQVKHNGRFCSHECYTDSRNAGAKVRK